MMNRALIVALVLSGILVAAAAGYWFGSVREVPPAGRQNAPARAPGQAPSASTAADAAKGQVPIPVEVTRVGTASLPQAITAVGTLRSDESVTLRPEVTGRITAILFQEGQRVAKGETLVQLDPAINTAELQQARANLTLARTKYDRAVDLAGRNFISNQAKDEAKGNLDIAQASVALVEAKLAKMELKAPFAGIIGLRGVSVGDYVKEGADLVNLEAIDPLKVDFRVPETFLTQVHVGQPVKVSLDALPGNSYDGKVIALNPLVDAAGRAIVIRAQVRNQNTALRPGMFARVTLITRAEKDALVLPEEALVPQGTEQYLFRVIDGKAARVKVETGQRRDGKVEIVAGVEQGDVVVSAGQSRLRDGATVRIADKQTGSVAPAVRSPAATSPPSPEGRETGK